VSPAVIAQLAQYPWPGNVRELENVLERSFVFVTGSRLEHVEVPNQTCKLGSSSDGLTTPWAEIKKQALEDVEKSYLELTLKRFHGNVKEVAKSMELTPRAVYHKLTQYRLNPGAFRTR